MFKRLMSLVLRRGQLVFLRGLLSGHFYSPIPNLKTLPGEAKRPETLEGIELRGEQQRDFYERLQTLYGPDLPFPWVENDQFGVQDSWTYYVMLRYSKPQRVVEVGSGYSSLLLQKTNEQFFSGSIRTTFIEPYPPAFLSGNVVAKRVQDVPPNLFEELDAGDILFVDSSHVAKIGSDVNHLIFEILPRLKSGVRVHFHDIVYPFEYPLHWVRDGKAWNEAYLLRAFLSGNAGWEIELWTSYLGKNGGSIWLRNVD